MAGGIEPSSAQDDRVAVPGASSSATTDGEPEPLIAVAWRVLSSPRTFLALGAVLALFLAVAATVPQRASPAELARALPFASADAASGLGLTDALVAWPTLLLVLLMALNAVGIFVARSLGRGPSGALAAQASAIVPALGVDAVRARLGRVPALRRLPLRLESTREGARVVARRGPLREGAAVALLGLVALAIGLALARGSALEARLTLAPGTGALSEAIVRDGELLLPRAFPWALACARPDPQDPRRAFDCRLGGAAQPAAIPVSLAPGYASKVTVASASGAMDFELRPLAERPRRFDASEAYEVVLTRPGSGPERLRLEPGQTVALTASGDQLTAFPGPDGPMIVVEGDGHAPVLLAPPTARFGSATNAGEALRLEVEPATTLTVGLATAPEAPLVLAGVLLVTLGLLLMAAVPHLTVVLEPAGEGTRVAFASVNRPELPRAALGRLLAEVASPPSGPA